MSVIDDGVIKFNFSTYEVTEALAVGDYSELEEQRVELYRLKMIGEYLPEKIGFGNISMRKDFSNFLKTESPQFIITGTQTGGLPKLNGKHYTRVVGSSLGDQSVACYGPIKASSESLTHAAVYSACDGIQAVVHVHHRELWENMLKLPFDQTNESIPYGTPEMATEVFGLIKGKDEGVLVMAGHQDGVIFYSSNICKAAVLTIQTYQSFVGNRL